MLEASGLENIRSFIQELGVLQQCADSLFTDLVSALQDVAQQTEDHQTLLDIRTRLQTEMEDYRELLDGPSPDGYELMKISQGNVARPMWLFFHLL